MFLRARIRHKDGQLHRYWSVVESRRVAGQRVGQRPLLYLGEINSSQAAAWRKSIAVLEKGAAQPRPLSLFAQDQTETLVALLVATGTAVWPCRHPAGAKCGRRLMAHRCPSGLDPLGAGPRSV